MLVSGAGIAGAASACLLGRAGHHVSVVERDRGARSSGDPVDVRGPAFDVAERLGLLPRLREVATNVREAVFVDAAGQRVASMPTRRSHDRALEVDRSDLCAALVERARSVADLRFDDVVTGIRTDAGGADVQFDRAAPDRFDLVVGADGLHSGVRRLASAARSASRPSPRPCWSPRPARDRPARPRAPPERPPVAGRPHPSRGAPPRRRRRPDDRHPAPAAASRSRVSGPGAARGR